MKFHPKGTDGPPVGWTERLFLALFSLWNLDTNFLDLAFRFPEGGEEKALRPVSYAGRSR